MTPTGTVPVAVASASLEPPLLPGPDEARGRLRRELLDPAYQDRDVLARVLDWITRQLDRATSAASSASPLVTLAAMVLVVGVLVTLAWLLSRARRSPRRPARAAVLAGGEVVRADDLAERARRALGAADHRTALVEGFRALAVRAVERGVLVDLPGATAREVAGGLAAAMPQRRQDLRAAAEAFDAALYGGRSPDASLAECVLDLDAWLRDVGSAPRSPDGPVPASGWASPVGPS